MLDTLICDKNELTHLPPLPDTLTTLYCCSNKLTTLPPLPNLKQLSCARNKFIRLELPDSLEHLYCVSNQLVELHLPTHLLVLYCNRNQLETLELNEALQHLDCGNNRITHIAFNQSLTHINVSHNPIVTLPPLPESILTLDIRHTKIHHCFDIPYSLEFIFTYGTPLCDKVMSYLNIDKPMSNPIVLRTTFEKIEDLEERFRYTYYCLKVKERALKWIWRIREKLAMEQYHPDRLMEWLTVHDYDSLESW